VSRGSAQAWPVLVWRSRFVWVSQGSAGQDVVSFGVAVGLRREEVGHVKLRQVKVWRSRLGSVRCDKLRHDLAGQRMAVEVGCGAFRCVMLR
jgi:hypothetical protein